MEYSQMITNVSLSLDVIASGDSERIRKHAQSSGVKFDPHDPVHIVMSRLVKKLSEELDGIAHTLERVQGL